MLISTRVYNQNSVLPPNWWAYNRCAYRRVGLLFDKGIIGGWDYYSIKGITSTIAYLLASTTFQNKIFKRNVHRHAAWYRNQVYAVHISWVIMVWISRTFQSVVYY